MGRGREQIVQEKNRPTRRKRRTHSQINQQAMKNIGSELHRSRERWGTTKQWLSEKAVGGAQNGTQGGDRLFPRRRESQNTGRGVKKLSKGHEHETASENSSRKGLKSPG